MHLPYNTWNALATTVHGIRVCAAAREGDGGGSEEAEGERFGCVLGKELAWVGCRERLGCLAVGRKLGNRGLLERWRCGGGGQASRFVVDEVLGIKG
jgi:hypothetical protein